MTDVVKKKRNLTHPRFAESRERQAARKAEMLAMEAGGSNRSDIARAMGLSRERVRQVLGNKT